MQHVSLTCPHFSVSNLMCIFCFRMHVTCIVCPPRVNLMERKNYVKTVAYSSSSYITMLSCYYLSLRPRSLLEPICCQHPQLLLNLGGGSRQKPQAILEIKLPLCGGYVLYEGWNFNSGNYLFTTDTK